MKKFIKNLPIAGTIAQYIYFKWINPPKPFPGSENYWIERYESGGNSGDGSYNILAEFKAEILNGFIREENIETIIEFGCGDGNQLRLANYKSYIGFDVSLKAISMCKNIFAGDCTKKFILMKDYNEETAHLTISLDVIFHLIEDIIFNEYMHRLFDSAERFVIIYSSNICYRPDEGVHIKHRKFTQWIEENRSQWQLRSFIPNRHPFKGDTNSGSFADFYIYEKA